MVESQYPLEINNEEVVVIRILFKRGFKHILLVQLKNGLNISVNNCEGYFEVGEKLFLTATYANHNKYPNSYNCDLIKKDRDISIKDGGELGVFLKTIISEKTAIQILEKHPFKSLLEILKSKSLDKLMEVDGVGEKIAQKIIDSYEKYNDIDYAFIQLTKYNLTKGAVAKIVKHYGGNAALAVDDINNNPYNLTKIRGFGFKKADACYLHYHQSSKEALHSNKRIIAFMEYFFEELASSGDSYCLPQDLLKGVLDYIPGVSNKAVVELFKSSEQFETLEYEGSVRLVLKRVADKEREVASLLKAKKDIAPLKLNHDDVENIIKEKQNLMGYQFSGEQIKAIHGMIENGVFLIQGYAGTGKTTSMSAFTEILKNNDFNFIQCCVSGKAADNLAKTTGYESKTIDSLILDYNNTLGLYDVVIIDEISMVDIDRFLGLLRKMRPSARLVMMGDSAQLDSIGIGVMKGLMNSNSIPTVILEEIHRQAQDSAIITHSMCVRKGENPKELSPTKNKLIAYGENKDLSYLFVDDNNEEKLLKDALLIFKKLVEVDGVDDVQMLCSTKATGAVSVSKLNSYAQLIANKNHGQEITIESNGSTYKLKVGDRIINTVNTSDESVSRPIFNGNTGRILSISEEIMLVDFDGIGEVTIAQDSWNNIQLGYAMTCHKSQGSTIKKVIVVLPFHYLLNSRELLYTAMTRASEKAYILTSKRSLNRSLSVSSKIVSKTNLENFIKEIS